jgi:hypothetical protein
VEGLSSRGPSLDHYGVAHVVDWVASLSVGQSLTSLMTYIGARSEHLRKVIEEMSLVG